MERFWDFSVRTYRTPGVPDACLSLQNEHGIDVNMLLFCCWVGAVIGEFDGELFDRAREYSVSWAENVVIPLRDARTWMKHRGCDLEPVPTDACMALREEIKTVEFAAEKMQQEVLESLAVVDQAREDKPGQVIADASANLDLYLECRDVQRDANVNEKLSIIVRAAFPDVDERSIAEKFAS